MAAVLVLVWFSTLLVGQTAKPKLTLDEFFNSVSFDSVKLSPDGNSVLIATERPDWEQQIFRKELWLYRISGGSGTLVQLTESGRDKEPEWSPNGQWIAFLSERKAAAGKSDDDGGDESDKEIAQLYLISPNGGEAFSLTSSSEEVHSFAWAADSKSIYFATRQPWSKEQTDDHKKNWKDVVQYRGDERGDAIFRLDLDEALARHRAAESREISDTEKDSNVMPGAVPIARAPLRVDQMTIARDGKKLAFVSNSVSQRQEKTGDIEIYLVSFPSTATSTPKSVGEIKSAGEITAPAAALAPCAQNPSTQSPSTQNSSTQNPNSSAGSESAPCRLTQNEAVELNLQWAEDNRHLFFQINLGSIEKKYEDPQPRLYSVNADSGAVTRWFAQFPGEVVKYTAMPDGSVVCACRLGTEIQLYSQTGPQASPVKREGWFGEYENPDSARNSPRLAFVYSAIERPAEVYISDGPDKLVSARPITSFNDLFTKRDLPKAKPYHWTSNDGTPIEGMLMYPPEKFEAKDLPVLVFIHGGPQDADGNHFEADWYQWDRLAATAGWLVFEPNYRGSTGYGDKFALAIVPEAFSGPGRDILAGVDALVKDGIADPERLAIGGYSYGGYMTNWLITQTTRFKAAVTGAGGVENVADWGNDDSTFDDSYFLGGTPWEARDRYNSEAAIFQINKVHTPTHMVAGADDIRVPVLEDYLLDRALHELGVPSDLLIFPGEGHSIDKNPWHGKIKVREELKWLAKYGGVGTN
ncbi:MAG: prolyl oligopeptidase family serine peptidase [Terriglobales bacterium]